MNCQWPKCGCAEREQCKPEKPSVAEIDLTQFAGHTPGPWKADNHMESRRADAVRTVKDGSFIARCQSLFGRLHVHADQHEPNARLIAAAPDLLAAYQAALARAEMAERIARGWKALADAREARVEAAERQRDEAIARAEAAERKSQEWKDRAIYELSRAEAAERQRDEAWTAGAEAMREAAARKVLTLPYEGWDDPSSPYRDACVISAAALRSLPIPAQEGK